MPFLANFYKHTGMSGTTNFDKLVLYYSLQLIFFDNIVDLFFWYFWQIFSPWYFYNLFFCYSLQLILGQSFRIIFLANHVNLFFWYFCNKFFPWYFCKIILFLSFLENPKKSLQIKVKSTKPWGKFTDPFDLVFQNQTNRHSSLVDPLLDRTVASSYWSM